MQESQDEITRELRAKEIYRVGTRGHINFNIISNAITQDTPIQEWKTFVLETLTAQKSTLESPTSKFSMRQLILDKAEGNDISGAEREVISDEFTKERCREAVAGVFLPREVFKSKTTNKRDLTAGVDSAGGYTIDDSLADLIQPLDPDLPMLSRVRKTYGTKPFSIPRKLTKTHAEWLSETGEAEEQDVEFDEIKQRPFNLVGWSNFSERVAYVVVRGNRGLGPQRPSHGTRHRCRKSTTQSHRCQPTFGVRSEQRYPNHFEVQRQLSH